MNQALRHLTGIVVACAMAACSAASQSGENSMGHPAAAGAKQGDDQTVEVRLGPHRFRIPANYFDIPQGQDSQGFMRLILRWPDLEPLPPGVHYLSGEEADRNRNIDISPDYIDRVPLQTSLDRDLISSTYPEHELRENPTLNPDLRIKGEPVYGLTPYYTDFAKVDAYYQQRHGRKDIPATDRHSVFNNDWFVARDASGTLTTVIKCTSREEPEGARIVDGQLQLLDTPRLPSCNHSFLMPRYGTNVRVSYLRIFMHDWQRIERRVRDIFDAGYLGDAPP